MLIKLKTISESDKAYQLPNGSWIPKSILDSRGLKHPFYQIKDWWLTKSVESIREEKSNKESAMKQFLGLQPMVIKMCDLPADVLKCWKEYWGSQSDHFMTDSTDRRWEIGEWELGIYS